MSADKCWKIMLYNEVDYRKRSIEFCCLNDAIMYNVVMGTVCDCI